MDSTIKKILVAEDDPDTIVILQQGLRTAGFKVSVATNGEEALEKFNDFHPDIVLLDITMPRLDGWEVLDRLHSGWKSRKIPVIMLTANNKDEDKLRGYEHGAVYYVTKPFNLQKLVNVIRNVLFGEK